MKIAGLLREVGTATPVADGSEVDLTDAGGAVATVLTGEDGDPEWPNGYWEYAGDLNPHGSSLVWEHEADSGQIRKESALALPVYAGVSLAELVLLAEALGDGVIAGFAVTAGGSGTAEVAVGAGRAVVRGYPCVVRDGVTVTGASNGTGSARADTLVLRVTPFDNGADSGTAELAIVTGTTLTQTAATWEFPVCRLSLSTGNTYTVGDDLREMLPATLGQRRAVVANAGRVESAPTALAASATAVVSTTLTLEAGVYYEIEADGDLLCKAGSGGAVRTYVSIDGEAGPDYAHGQTSFVLWPNSHHKAAVLGAGAAINVRLHAWYTGAAGQHAGGIVRARAIPRY